MDRWSEYLRELESIDPEDPIWEDAPRFLEQLQNLIASKQEIRQQRARFAHLRQSLEELRGELRFLGLDIPFPADLSPEIVRTLEELLEALREHARIRQQFLQAATQEEWEELENRRRQCGLWIQQKAEALRALGSPTESLPGPEQTITLPSPESREAPTAPEESPSSAMPLETTAPASEPTVPLPSIESVHEVISPPVPVELEREPEAWEHTFWTWIEEGDLPGAFWLARAAEAQGLFTPVPPAILAILQGVRWLDHHREKMVPEIRRRVEETPLPSHGPGAMMALAAALYGALAAPESGLSSYLEASFLGEPIETLARAIRQFSLLGWPLTAIEIRSSPAARLEEADQEVQRVVARARNWWERAPQRTMNYQRATEVWQLLLKGRGEGYLEELLRPVQEDRREATAHVREAIQRWEDPHHVERRIRELARGVQIVGTARDQLRRRVEEACQLAREWIQQVEQWEAWRQRLDQEGWWHEQIQGLIRTLQAHLPAARTSLEARQTTTNHFPERAALRWLLRALERVEALIHGQEELPFWSEPLWPLEEGLEAALAIRLLWVPEIPREESGIPLPDSLPAILHALLQPRDPQHVLEAWLTRREYGFARRLIDLLLPEDMRTWARGRLEEAFRSNREAMRRRLNELSLRIEKETLAGILEEEERSALTGRLEGIRRGLEEPTERLEHELRFLEEESRRVEEDLERLRRDLSDMVTARWEKVEKRLEQLVPDSSLRDQIARAVGEALKSGNLRLASDYLDHLEELQEGQPVDRSLFVPRRSEPDPLERFVRTLPEVISFLEQRSLSELAERVRQDRRLPRENLPADRYMELGTALEAWHALKTGGIPALPTQMRRYLRNLMEFLGFQIEREWEATPVRQEHDWALYRVSMRPLVTPLVYQYGTECAGKYNVLLLWNRPGFEAIGGILEHLHLTNRPALIFYFGRLLPRQREDLAYVARQRHWIAVVLDEALLWFLGGEYENRLNAFLRCALPFTDLNPYTPFMAGSVPPEIFVGRKDMIRDLLSPSGPGLVYGGRQLGKSALLRQVQREFHQPKNGQFALYREIKKVGDPSGEDAQQIWRHIRQALLEAEMLPRHTPEDPEALERALARILNKSSEHRILFLFDEADAFLKADAEHNFPIVSRIKQLIDQTQRRIRVVFAGLHNVQRFYNLSANHPLAHLGQPIKVGPLTPPEARELIVRPIEAIGFRFRDESPILRILAYTHRHPGLIQLFCKHLVDHMHRRPPGSLPPWEITLEDVEVIYRQPEVREGIVERFRWTLALDPHYEVITLAMCLDLRTAPHARDPDYTVFELETMAREHWPRGFHGLSSEDFRAYLDELVGLGILLRSETGRYRLRSSSLPALIGAPEWMASRLEELSKQSPEPPLRIDEHHPVLNPDEDRYSPFTFAQERRLTWEGYGVGLIFGSPALGFDDLREALKRLLPPESALDAQGHILEEIHISAATEEGIARALDKLLERHRKSIRLLILRRLPSGSEPQAIVNQIRGAIRWCQKHSRTRTPSQVQVLFLFDPAAIWTWVRVDGKIRQSLEDEARTVITLSRWTIEGIRQRLRHRDWMDTEEVCRKVYEATGGWGWLLDLLFDQNQENDPRPAAERLRARLFEETEFSWNFIRRAGLDVDNRISPVLRELAREDDGKGIPVELLPELINLQLGKDEFQRVIDYLERIRVISIERDLLKGEPLLYVEPLIRDLMRNAQISLQEAGG